VIRFENSAAGSSAVGSSEHVAVQSTVDIDPVPISNGGAGPVSNGGGSVTAVTAAHGAACSLGGKNSQKSMS